MNKPTINLIKKKQGTPFFLSVLQKFIDLNKTITYKKISDFPHLANILNI